MANKLWATKLNKFASTICYRIKVLCKKLTMVYQFMNSCLKGRFVFSCHKCWTIGFD